MNRFNRNVQHITPSASMVVMAKAKQLKAVDPEIVDMGGGEPDFGTPKKICDELFKQIEAGYTHYTVGSGLPELRKKIAEKLAKENGCHYTPEGIVVTPGGKFAIYLAVRALVEPGDEVICLNPGWVSYPSIVEASNGVPVFVDLDYRQGYRIDFSAIEKKITDKTKLIIINYPNNPTGRILTRAEADEFHQLLLRHPGLYVIADEIYERIVYDGNVNISLGSYEDIADRVITINGFSKCVAMTGWRIGYMAAGEELAGVCGKLFSHTMTCVSGFIQKSAIQAFECDDEIEQMRKTYEERRDVLMARLNKTPRVFCMVPEGAFYAWVKFDLGSMDSNEVCEYILEKAKVAGVPGISYGEKNGSWMRFSFATSMDQILQAANNIERVMQEYDPNA